MRAVVGEDMACSVTLTSGTVTGMDRVTRQVQLRESSVFRKEGGDWKMITHHADAIRAWGEVVEGA